MNTQNNSFAKFPPKSFISRSSLQTPSITHEVPEFQHGQTSPLTFLTCHRRNCVCITCVTVADPGYISYRTAELINSLVRGGCVGKTYLRIKNNHAARLCNWELEDLVAAQPKKQKLLIKRAQDITPHNQRTKARKLPGKLAPWVSTGKLQTAAWQPAGGAPAKDTACQAGWSSSKPSASFSRTLFSN